MAKIITKENEQTKEQVLRNKFDRACMLSQDFDEGGFCVSTFDNDLVTLTIGAGGCIRSWEVEKICKEFNGHFLDVGLSTGEARFVLGGLEWS